MRSFQRDRYLPEEFIASLKRTAMEIIDDEYLATLAVGEDKIYVSAKVNGQSTEDFLAILRSVLIRVGLLDNLVQQSCEAEQARSGLDPSIYELYLANIYLDGPSLTFTYFGSQVNTQWDANFQLVNGQWQKANF